MSNTAELAPTPAPTEAEASATPEKGSELRDAAAHAAAIVALNETAAHSDLTEDEVQARQVLLDAKFSVSPEAPEIETTEIEAPAANDLVGAIEQATAEAETKEDSYAAALVALEDERRKALLNVDFTASHQEWDDGRIEEAKAGVEAKIAAKREQLTH